MSEEERQKQRDKQAFRDKVARYRAIPLRIIMELDEQGGDKCEGNGDSEGSKKSHEHTTSFSNSNSLEKGSVATAVLDCGHRKALPDGLMGLRVGDSVRCPECYEDGMKCAERMVPKLNK